MTMSNRMSLVILTLLLLGGCVTGSPPPVQDPDVVESVVVIPHDSLFCIGVDPETDPGVLVLGWLATNGFLDTPEFARLFQGPCTDTDEWVKLAHLGGRSVAIVFYGNGWEVGHYPNSYSDRLPLESFLLLSPDERLDLLFLDRLYRGIDVDGRDSTLAMEWWRRWCADPVNPLVFFPDSIADRYGTNFADMPADSQTAFVKQTWREPWRER